MFLVPFSSLLLFLGTSLIKVEVLPLLHCSSSASSLWMLSFIDLFFSFSFSYFFFHCSAVSSKFTVTVFRMVLALIGGKRGRNAGGVERRGWGWGKMQETTKERKEERIGLSETIFQLWLLNENGLHLINLHVNGICASCVCWTMEKEEYLSLCLKQNPNRKPPKPYLQWDIKDHEVLTWGYKLLLKDDVNLHHQSWNIYAATAAALNSGCEFWISDYDFISHSTKKTLINSLTPAIKAVIFKVLSPQRDHFCNAPAVG